MIQRIQTVYLFLASLALILLFFFPYIEITGDDAFVKEETVNLLFTIIPAVLFLAAIFLFKNRMLQRRVTRIALYFIVALIVSALYFAFYQNADATQVVQFEFGGLLPVLSLLFAVLALRGINKDEQLVRSIDRLR